MGTLKFIKIMMVAFALLAGASVFFSFSAERIMDAGLTAYDVRSIYMVESPDAEVLAAAARRSALHNNMSQLFTILLALTSVVGTFCVLRTVKETMRKERDAAELTRLIMENSPAGIEFWDDKQNVTYCNRQMADILGIEDVRDYIGGFANYMPEVQPCGTNSIEKTKMMVAKVLEEGRINFEWMHITKSGEECPVDVNLALVTHNDESMIIAYTHDMRPFKEAEKKEREAEEESRAKTRFLARMSHEIRTPMNAVIGIAENQLHNVKHPPETEEAFMRIYCSSNLLLTIINDILDLSKVESGKMEIEPVRYEFAGMVVDIVQLSLMRLGSKEIEFRLAIDEKIPTYLTGDEWRIKQILNNLLSNAFRYTQTGVVELNFALGEAPAAGGIILIMRVRDTGQGMDGGQIANLFKIDYTRFNAQNNRAIEGSGLGMMIARQLIELMQGEIFVESTPGEGSVFEVRIPQGVASGETLGAETVANLQNLEMTQKSLRRLAKFTREPMPYGRVLVVDDVETNLYVVRNILMPYKIAAETVTSGRDAIERIKEGATYDIIFMDHMMPDLDGIETTKILRGMGYDAPIVALTANVVDGVEDTFADYGFDGFIAKPINFIRFDACLQQFIRDKQPPSVIAETKRQDSEPRAGALNLTEPFLKDARTALAVFEKFDGNPSAELLKSFTIQAHAMKSALRNIGRQNLSKVASILERAGRDGDLGTIGAFFPSFVENLHKLVAELQPEHKNVSEENAAEDTDLLRACFGEIAAACETFDINAARAALSRLDGVSCTSKTKEIIRGISDSLMLSDYDEAASLAEKGINL